jgi:hypothetical protein
MTEKESNAKIWYLHRLDVCTPAALMVTNGSEVEEDVGL